MKAFILFLSICLFETGFAQKNIDFGNVDGNNIRECNNSANSKVSQAKSQLNIFFIDMTKSTGRSRSVSLSYDGNTWSAKRYESDWIQDKVDSFALKPIISFDSIFSALKANKIFLLPDQKKLGNIKGNVDDGNEYTISFRAGCKIRSYKFNNPSLFKKYNKNVPEFVNYEKITEIFLNWLKRK